MRRTKIEPLQLDVRSVPSIGARVFVIGNPRELRTSLSEGLVSGIPTRPIQGVKCVQTTAAVSSGSSGSPLIGTDGSVVGVMKSSRVYSQSLNFAATADQVRELLECRDEPIPLSSFAEEVIDDDIDEWDLLP